MGGAGLAADSQALYFLDGNGTFDTTLNAQGFPVNGDYGNAFMKISVTGQLAVADYFTMFNTVQESDSDEDLGSGGAMILPDLMDGQGHVHHLAVGAGKDGNLYVVDRDNMGNFNRKNDNAIYQEIDGVLPGGVWAMPAYFNNTVYYGSVGSPLKAFSITNAKLSTSPTGQTATSGRSRTPIRRCCMPTTLPIFRTSCTTATKPDRATSLVPATNSSLP